MPYNFSLPTTSTTHRGVVRNALKKHKRLPPQAQTTNLNAALSDRATEEEKMDVVLEKEIEVEWRSCIAATLPGREPPRMKGQGLDYELCCVLSTLGCIHSLLARSQIHMLYAAITPTIDQRVSIISAATKHLLDANSVHMHLANRLSENCTPGIIPETSSSAQGALARIALAEATLLAVLKDDPWPGVVAQDRNKNDKEWMIKPPEIPKVRSHLFARLCLAAADHAGTAESMLSSEGTGRSGQIDAALVRYVNDLKRTSRAKACRFFGIDADMGGETGKGIAWLNAAEEELGLTKPQVGGSRLQGLAKLKKDWTERKEDKKVEKGGDWGSDAGRFEENRIVEVLKSKWNKMNDTVNTQVVPPSGPLIANMPSGRDIHSTKLYKPPVLDADTLARMRAPPNKGDDAFAGDDSSSSDDDEDLPRPAQLPGTFPGGAKATANDSYY
ncbi:NADH-ubiquinone oxidoreductase 12 kda subunit [Physcia stellaris]|nr:NADH-ubiquinone oxidoreductase 12 kda subunit [Physcia stellaris]